jgi:hypothetical protein
VEKARHGALLPLVASATTIVPVMRGRKEQECTYTLAVALAKESLSSVPSSLDWNALAGEPTACGKSFCLDPTASLPEVLLLPESRSGKLSVYSRAMIFIEPMGFGPGGLPAHPRQFSR